MIRIYIGPSLQGLVSGTLFRGSNLPGHVGELVKRYPDIPKLIVPIEGLQKAREDVRTRGTVLNVFANNILKMRK